jgi:hypothetical protein
VIVRKCAEPGCDTLVVGGLCLEHEAPMTRVFVRGRPFVHPEVTSGVIATPPLTATTGFGFAVGDRVAPGFTKAGGRLPSPS